MDIVSWATLHNYSINKEIFCFALTLSIPTVICYFLPKINLEKIFSIKEQKEIKIPKIVSHLAIPLVIYLLILNLNTDGPIDMFHEGEKLQTGIPFKDFYIQHGLILNYIIPQIGMMVFGESVEAVRKIFTLLDPLSYIVVYFLGLELFKGRALIAIIPTIFYSGLNYWVGLRQACCLLVLIVLIKAVNKNSKALYITAGILNSVCIIFSLEYGLYALAASLLFLIFKSFNSKSKKHLRYLIGLLIGIFSISTIFSIYNIFSHFTFNTYNQLAHQGEIWGLPFFDFSLDPNTIGFKAYLSIAIMALFCCYLGNKGEEIFHSKNNQSLLLTLLFSIFFFRTALGRSDLGHLIDGTTLLLILVLYPIDKLLFCSSNKLIKTLSLISLVVLCLYLNKANAPISKYLSNKKYFSNSKIEIKRLGNISIPNNQLKVIKEVKSFVENNSKEGDYIYDFSNQSAYYFILNRKSPGRFFKPIYASTIKQQKEVVRNLKSQEPKLIIFKSGSIYDKIDGISSIDRHKIIYNYIKKNYISAFKVEQTIILKLRNYPNL